MKIFAFFVIFYGFCQDISFHYEKHQLSELSMSVLFAGSTDKTAETFVFVHGFPEGSWLWTTTMQQLWENKKNRRMMAPDLRGYNATDKMPNLEDYEWDHLVGDVVELIDLLTSGQKVHVIGHDWGLISWGIANKSEKVTTLTVLNAPHPSAFVEALLTDTNQELKSSYMRLFCSSVSTSALGLDNFLALREGYSTKDDKPWFADMEPALLASWGNNGTVDAGLNWYRANIGIGVFESWSSAMSRHKHIPRDMYLTKPVLAIWGMADVAFNNELLLNLTQKWVPDFKIFKVEYASHQIAQEYPQLVAIQVWNFVTGQS